MCDEKTIDVCGNKITTTDLYNIAYKCRYGHTEELINNRFLIASIIESYMNAVEGVGEYKCLKL